MGNGAARRALAGTHAQLNKGMILVCHRAAELVGKKPWGASR